MGVLAARRSMLGIRFGGEHRNSSGSSRGREESKDSPSACHSAEDAACVASAVSVGPQPYQRDFEAHGSQRVPLAFVRVGSDALISYVRGGDQKHHLENLGFVEGSRVRVVSETGGNLVVEVKGAQVALDRRIAMKIFTTV